MIFTETNLKGVYLVDIERREDERGFFARVWDGRAFEERGLEVQIAQCSISFNREKGTVRGMHYQAEPFPEVKIVRCTMGAVYDVILDLRPASPTFRQWASAELTADNRKMAYIPRGLAHGFQTLQAGSEVLYQISEFHHPECERGVRWDDPAFRIRWPLPERPVISQRDLSFPDFRPD